ncbi:hypothetical protein GN958_ATG08857 [Phytophthora infestans]|uniref:Uncharacterized protein n=1 Tax=Phytophthora infestans TaxID=4787 RepID=A0A8S9UUT5_PHYIN|nr:hypothetical protein GN958_ATG08857 [Phytophthora infestans]
MIPIVRTASSSRPHTFGRSSNVWQYLDLVHERNNQPSRERLEAFAESIDGDESDEDDDSLARGKKSAKLKQRGSKTTTPEDENTNQRHSNTQRMSTPFLPNVESLPDLHQSARLREELRPLGILATSPSTLVGAGLRVVGGPNVNSTEIMKRLNALGTSTSTPLIPPASPSNNGHGIENQLTQSQNLPMNQGSGVLQVSAIPTPGVAVPATSTTNITPVSDAEKLRNDFNSQATRLSYGCSVALELFNGHLMMVGSPDGHVRVQSLEKLQTPQAKGYKDRAIFTLLDLVDVRSAGSIRYGDSVWLQLSVGPGDVSWEQGGVLGAKVREAPQLKALGLLDDDSIRNDVQAPAAVGYPVPVTAYLPKSRDDGDMQVDEIQSRLRNKTAKMLGKWIIRSAVCQRRKQKDNFVYNNDEVYLEQDWFYLGADSDAGVAVLRQLPPAVVGKDTKPGEYVVERRGAWKLRLLDSSSGSAGLSLAQQQMERLLLRAKAQLKQSNRMRAGQTKVYGPNLRGGTGFTAQLRAQVAASTRQIESRCADHQERRLKHINRHLNDKARGMNIAVGLEDTANLTRRSSRPNSNASGKSRCESLVAVDTRKRILNRTASVDSIHATTGRSCPEKSGVVPETNDLKRATLSAPDASISSCALCHSSSIGYNLCCQFRDVMQMLEHERLVENTTRNETTAAPHNHNDVNCTQVTRRTARSRLGRTARPDDIKTTITNENTARHGPESIDTRTATPHTANTATIPLNDRVLQLFAKEDAAMIDLIKFKEREAYRALYEQAQGDATLSPLAAHFRDRFKHVGLFMQMHRQQQQQQQQVQQDGIGGHFQKLHADLLVGSRTNPDESDYYSDYDSDDDVDSETSNDGQQEVNTQAIEARKESDENIVMEPERLFPTPQELEKLTPVDTKAALALYVQNRHAMAEMLDGYAELVSSQMIPTLKASLSTRNRGALMETLDFVARASEFVCARRVQVFVAKLLHAVAESVVGDFTSYEKEFEELITEMEGAVNFIRFFLQTREPRRKNKNK